MLENEDVTIRSLNDYPQVPEIVEDGETFFENALKKAKVVSEHTGEWVIADDSGLEVDSLGGRPGVYSSRYSGPDATDDDNNRLLLQELQSMPPEKRGAAFRCVLVLYKPDGTYRSFDGELSGSIARYPAGSEGFGYDPVFCVDAYGKTVAELGPDIKNRISHRAKAFEKLKKSLQQHNQAG
jgi:XTP/dITP diphosphohydrolase